ncbi:MAG TPA: DUF4164 family protein [Methylocella sp.]|nr:DUF4164 family protein [Methylocella sp.]
MPGDQALSSAFPEELDLALRRLAAALDGLEAAHQRLAEAERQRVEAYALIKEERARLAAQLDAAVARSEVLDLANEEVHRRLSQASHHIRAVLSALEPDTRDG